MDDALDRHGAVAGHVGRTLQQRLERGLDLVDGIDVEHRVGRRSGPLNRRAVLDDELLVDEVLEREEVASLQNRIVAVHLEDARAGVNLQVERTLAAGPHGVARHGQLDLGVGAHVECQRDVHLSRRGALLALLALEAQLLELDGRERIGGGGLDEGDEVGRRDVRLARKGHEEGGVAGRRRRHVHVDAQLVAPNPGAARGVDLAVEEVVVAARGVEHEHLLGRDAQVVGDVGHVAQIEAEVERAAVALAVEHRGVFGAEEAVLHLERHVGHRVGHLREVDRGREPRGVNRPREFAVAAAPRQDEVQIGQTARAGDDPREHGVEQPHVEAVDAHAGVVAPLRGGVEAPHERVALDAVGHRQPRAVALEVPLRGQPHGRGRDVVHLEAVELDVGRELTVAQHRLHHREAVRAPLDDVAHAVGELRQGGQVEVAQTERERVVAAARGDAVERQHLLVVAHVEAVDDHARGVELDVAGQDAPHLVAADDARGENPQTDDPSRGAVLVGNRGADAQLAREAARRVGESRRELDVALPRAARHREVGQMEHAEVEVLGRGVERERVTAVRGVDVEPRGQHAAPLDVVRSGPEGELVARRVEEQLEFRAVGHLQPLGDGVHHRIDVADADRQQRIVVGQGDFPLGGAFAHPGVVEHRQVAGRTLAQVGEDLAVAGLAAEGGVGEVRAQFDELARGRVLARHRDVLGRERLVVVEVGGVEHLDAAVQVVERAAARAGHHARRELRDGVAPVEVQRCKVGPMELHHEVVAGRSVVQVDQSEEVEVEVGVAREDAAVELLVAQPAVEAHVVVGVALEFELADVAEHLGVGKAAADGAVDTGREGRAAQQLLLAQQLAEAERANAHAARHLTAARTQGLHRQAARETPQRRAELRAEVEQREGSAEAPRQVDATRAAEHGDRLRRELRPREGGGQRPERAGRGGQALHVDVEMRRGDVGKPLDRGAAHQGRTPDVEAADAGLEIGNRTRGVELDVRKERLPLPQLGGEVGQIVAQELRAAEGGVDLHRIDEPLVVVPRVAHQRDAGNLKLRAGRSDGRLLEADAAGG